MNAKHPLAVLITLLLSNTAFAETKLIKGTFSCMTEERIEIGLDEKGKKYFKQHETGNIFLIDYQFAYWGYGDATVTFSDGSSTNNRETPSYFIELNANEFIKSNIGKPHWTVHSKNRSVFKLYEYGLRFPGINLATDVGKDWQASSSNNSSYGFDTSVTSTLSTCVTDNSNYSQFKEAIINAAAIEK